MSETGPDDATTPEEPSPATPSESSSPTPPESPPESPEHVPLHDKPFTSRYDLNDPAKRMEGFAEAKMAFARSGLVVMPTDTVYGLACDAFDPTGVRRLLRAKGRGRAMPTPVLIGSADTLRALATKLTDDIRALASAFWPGGLTLICRQQPSLRWDLGDARSTVALRIPDHQDAIDLLSDNGPLAVSSANLTGHPPAANVQEAYDMLRDSVDVYLDGGPARGNLPSTIVDCTADLLKVVRVGVISVPELRQIVPELEAPEEPKHLRESDD